MDSSISHYTETALKSYAMNYNVTRNVTSSLLSRYESEVKVLGMQPMRKIVKPDNMSFISTMRATYGIIRIMQSCFLASIRMSSTYKCSGVHSTSVQHDNMATWQHGNMATWHDGNMAIWYDGMMA